MEVEEAYKVLQANCGIEVGDRVKVLRGYETDEMGCKGDNVNSKGHIGNIGTVYLLCSTWIHLTMDKGFNDDTEMQYPFFCLELVEKGKKPIMVGGNKVEIFDGKIHVCGITVSKQTLQEILNRLEEQN